MVWGMRSLAMLLCLIAIVGCGSNRQEANQEEEPPQDLGGPVLRGADIIIFTGPRDTLDSIAQKYSTSIEWLVRRNGLHGLQLKLNTRLYVPNPSAL